MRESIPGPFQLYPSNVMRNMARRGAKSDIHFIADGDMVMSEGFAIKAKKIANQMIDGKSKKLLVVRKHPGQVKKSRFLILSQPTGIRGCVILLEDEAISTEEQDELLFWDVLT
uniref:Uncharacterized protein n=1 Tax=Caenorhabditis japonica TaxID=281687 RepID=A0A8R1IPU3_CAEJA